MPLPRVYVNEPCPLDGYDGLTVRVLGNATDAEWREWAGATLGDPTCAECGALADGARCSACTATRAAWGRSIVLFYGPRLLDYDVSTPEQALSLFDDDTALPSEIVIWLQLVPGVVRARRTEQLLGNVSGSLTTPST